MALSPAEKQRAYRDRKKQQTRNATKAGEDATAAFIETPFPEHWGSDAERHEVSFLDETLGSIGLGLDFTNDEDPESDEGLAGLAPSRGALGRAERAVGALFDSAVALAGIVNRFKLAEIEKAHARIAQTDLSDAEVRAKALKELVALEEMKKLLSKEVRRSLPPIVITNEGTATV